MTLGEYVVWTAEGIVDKAVEEIQSGRISSQEELGEFVSRGLGQSAADIASMFTGTSSPMVQSLMASMQPTIMQVLQDYTPTFAAVSGGMLALAVLLGVYVAQETYRRGRR